MPLSTGTRVGPYEIVALLGAGGMGEVYRARDTKLNRDVAIKVLPDAVATDAERLARSHREAQILASLNHPNIAHIYGVEDASSTHAIVMELVEGPTLADRIAHEPIPLGEALAIARQIAEALEGAHEQGIVHRDLKPANIKVRDDGTVKVLDFGLAKLADPTVSGIASSHAFANSPTITSPAMMTRFGVILGTAAYMSPEQAKGRGADKRSDMWSFGCVLYEMLTGVRPFDGEDVAEMLVSVLSKEPDWSRLPAALPDTIRAVVKGCLERDRKLRIADGSMALFLMRQPPAVGITPAVVSRRARLWWSGGVAAALLLVMAIAAVAGRWTARPALESPVVRFSIPLDQNQQQFSRVLAISPDGTRVAYLTNARLQFRALSEPDPRPLTGAGAGVEPAFSPDGQFVAYLSLVDRTLQRVAVGGGAPVSLCPIDVRTGVSWWKDVIIFSQPDGIMRIPSNGGTPEALVRLKPGEVVYGPQMLPDGDSLLFTLTTATGPDQWDKADVVVQSLKSGVRRTLVQGGSAARYLSSGHLVYAVRGVLFAMPFDPGRLEARGAGVPVLEGVRRVQSGAAQFSVSESGTLIYVPGAPSSSEQTSLASLDDKGFTTALKLPPGSYESPRISPDGKRLAFGTDDGHEAIVWVYELDGSSSARRLTFGGNNRLPIWSRDGRHVAFQSDREGDRGIFWQPADVSGAAAERLTKADAGTVHVPESWSRQADWFSFSAVQGNAATLWTFSLRDRKTAPFGDVRSSSVLNSDVSPDGKWIAYTLRTGAVGIYVEPVPATGAKYQITKPAELAHHAMWGPDGKSLFYVAGGLPVVRVSIATQPAFSSGDPVRVPGNLPNNNDFGGPRNYHIAPDGGRFIFTTSTIGESGEAGGATTQMRVVLNWIQELTARVPAR